MLFSVRKGSSICSAKWWCMRCPRHHTSAYANYKYEWLMAKIAGYNLHLKRNMVVMSSFI
jgi:hypothetical protein